MKATFSSAAERKGHYTMKQKIPLKSIAAILSVVLLYSLMIVLVDKCGNIYDSGLFIGSADNSVTEGAEEDDVSSSDDSYTVTEPQQDDIANIYTQVDWWKAGIEDYGFMFDEMNIGEDTSSDTSVDGTQSTENNVTTAAPETTTEPTTTTPSTTTPTTTQGTTAPPATTPLTTQSQTSSTTQATSTHTTQREEPTTTVTERTENSTTTAASIPIVTTPPSEVTTNTPAGEDTASSAPSGSTVIPPHDLTGETLTVYDLMTGQYVTDDALTILIKTTWNEVGNFHEEAIKAQAVAAYTYIKYCNTYGIKASVALREGASQKSINAVKSVAGQAVYYNNKLIQATYCAATGGTTAASKNVWGNSYPYLVSVESAYDEMGGAYYGKQKTFTVDEIRSIIQSKTNIVLSDDPENWFTVLSYIDGKYVNELLIDGNSSCTLKSNGRTRKITGSLLRESIMGQSNLLSSQFEVSYSDGMFTFTTYGYGHGVGMSQYGAQYYATYAGWDYIDILTHYYTGVEIK